MSGNNTIPSSPFHGEDPSPPLQLDLQMKDRPRLDIILDSELVVLKGTGDDVDPATLSGHVALYLAESTAFKEIKLEFKGKARLPVTWREPSPLLGTQATMTYELCEHEWSFLEGEKNHSHKLKGGCHLFPFRLQIGGTVPSSIATRPEDAGVVSYKLRAHAIRSGLARNIQTTIPVEIHRSFTAESLEYQQTLEIENTWPGKIMYNIMLPHKAWAIGDTLTSLVKFVPIEKGVAISAVQMTVQETTKVYTRLGHQQHTRTVAQARHAVVRNRVVPCDREQAADDPSMPAGDIVDLAMAETSSHQPEASGSAAEDDGEIRDIESSVDLFLPCTILPSHHLDPIRVSHRARWTVSISNQDGHISELRCSLPIYILHSSLLSEARTLTSASRRLLFGGSHTTPPPEEDGSQLPSYHSHMRDRVANMFIPVSATIRVSNPWTQSGIPGQVLAHPFFGDSVSSSPPEGSSPVAGFTVPDFFISPTEGMPSRPPSPHSTDGSAHSSHRSSLANSASSSRLPSRSGSPERSAPHEPFVHNVSNASRSLQGLYSTSMTPINTLPHPPWLKNRSHSHPSIPTLASSSSQAGPSAHNTPSGLAIQAPADHLGRAFMAVPDYRIASRGFLGGVTPLTSTNGLPSYEASEAQTGRGDLHS